MSHRARHSHSFQSEIQNLSVLPHPTLSESVDEVSKDGATPLFVQLSVQFSALQEGNTHIHLIPCGKKQIMTDSFVIFLPNTK